MLAGKHRLPALVADIDRLGHHAVRSPLGMIALVRDPRDRRDRVADMDRPDEAQPVIAIGHGMRVDRCGRQADADREDHRAVRDALADLLRAAPFRVHMMREEIAGMPGMHHEIGLGDRPAERGPPGADLVIFEILLDDHPASS
jgi:hypothetical protein